MFDVRRARALGPGDLLTVDGAPGLRLMASASLRTWTYRYKSPADGRMRQVRLGHWPAMGFPAALAAWERLRALRDAGADPAADKRQRRAQVAAEGRAGRYTVRRACDEYLQAYRSAVTPKTYAEADRLLAGELLALQDRPAASITRADAFDLLEAMRSRPVVATRLRQLLGAVWDRALDAGRLAPEVPNWWRLVLRGKLPSRGKMVAGQPAGTGRRTLDGAEVTQLLRWLPNFSRDVDDALTLYLWTCCRGAEIVGLQRDDITDEPDGLWCTIPRARLKMRRNPLTTDLRVPLVGRALAVVQRRLQATDKAWLFPSPGGRDGHIQQKAVGVAVWSHMPYAGTRPDWVRPRLPVTHWAPHDLRRTGRTLLAALGCPSDVAEAILGHMPPGIQAIYNRHHYDGERRLWLTKLADRLERLGGPGPAVER